MADNQFVVDLGSVKLTDDNKKKINASIQRAVAGELANLASEAHNIALLPIGGTGHKFPGPILWGIIARPLDDKLLNQINAIK
jgi:hypothetical protein